MKSTEMRLLVIARGIPGSGKSTTILNNIIKIGGKRNSFVIASADNFWGEPYKYDVNLIQHAHQYCKLIAMSAMHSDINVVFVDNTNIQKRHYKDYIQMAKHFNYEIKFLMPNTDWAWDVEECFKRNRHNVPKEVIQRMKDQFEEDKEFPTINVT